MRLVAWLFCSSEDNKNKQQKGKIIVISLLNSWSMIITEHLLFKPVLLLHMLMNHFHLNQIISYLSIMIISYIYLKKPNFYAFPIRLLSFYIYRYIYYFPVIDFLMEILFFTGNHLHRRMPPDKYINVFSK